MKLINIEEFYVLLCKVNITDIDFLNQVLSYYIPFLEIYLSVMITFRKKKQSNYLLIALVATVFLLFHLYLKQAHPNLACNCFGTKFKFNFISSMIINFFILGSAYYLYQTKILNKSTSTKSPESKL